MSMQTSIEGYSHVLAGTRKDCTIMMITFRSSSAVTMADSSGGQMMRLRGLKRTNSSPVSPCVLSVVPCDASASQTDFTTWTAFLLTIQLLSSSLQKLPFVATGSGMYRRIGKGLKCEAAKALGDVLADRTTHPLQGWVSRAIEFTWLPVAQEQAAADGRDSAGRERPLTDAAWPWLGPRRPCQPCLRTEKLFRQQAIEAALHQHAH